MATLDKAFLENMRAFVQRVYEYRPPVDVEAGAMPYNTCDYYAMEEYMKEIDERIKQEDCWICNPEYFGNKFCEKHREGKNV